MTKITTDNNFGEITKFGDLAIGDMFVCAWFPETAFIRIDDGKNGKNEGINAAPIGNGLLRWFADNTSVIEIEHTTITTSD